MDPEALVASLLARASHAGPCAPADITAILPPAHRAAQTFPPPPGGQHARSGPPHRGDRGDRGDRGNGPPEPSAGYVPFRINWGERHGADPRRLLALVCRKGGIRGSEVGTIRIGGNQSTFEVAAPVADGFAKAVQAPDTRDPKIRITPLDASPAPGNAPAGAPASAPAPAAVPAAPPAGASAPSPAYTPPSGARVHPPSGACARSPPRAHASSAARARASSPRPELALRARTARRNGTATGTAAATGAARSTRARRPRSPAPRRPEMGLPSGAAWSASSAGVALRGQAVSSETRSGKRIVAASSSSRSALPSWSSNPLRSSPLPSTTT